MNVENLTEALTMFAFLSVELTVLFLVISYGVGVLQQKLPPEKIQRILGDKNGKGYVVAALLGAITPFCSCSTIPFLKGLLRAKAGFGTTLVFLFASPLLNPIIIGLFFVTFGWQVTVFYFLVSMGVSVVAGVTLERLGYARYVREEAYMELETSCCTAKPCGGEISQSSLWKKVWQSTWSDFKNVLPYLLVGISIGSLIYGFIPTDFIASVAGDESPFAIPVAAVIGVPLYIRAESVIPLSAALVSKGMGLGSVMALIIGSAGASLTEVILLKSIFKNKMIYAFVIVILVMAVGSGYLYQIIF